MSTAGTRNHKGSSPVVIGPEAYTSESFARAEADNLWPKVWQNACRVEELPNIGDYVTYDIMDESIIVVRTSWWHRSAIANRYSLLYARVMKDEPQAPTDDPLVKIERTFKSLVNRWTVVVKSLARFG